MPAMDPDAEPQPAPRVPASEPPHTPAAPEPPPQKAAAPEPPSSPASDDAEEPPLGAAAEAAAAAALPGAAHEAARTAGETGARAATGFEGCAAEDDADTDVDAGVEAGVAGYVDEVVHKASFAAGVLGERERVQSLIYNLVDKVKTRGGDEGAAGQEAENPDSAKPTAAAAAPAKTTGVPYGDQRAYCTDDRGGGGLVRDLFWTQNSETVTLTVVLGVTPPPASARDITVVFGSASLVVLGRGEQVLRETPAAPLDADSCLWSLDRSRADAPALTLELEKATAAWWPTLFKSHDPASYRVYQAAASAERAASGDAAARTAEAGDDAATAPSPPPPPPPPQARPLSPTDDAARPEPPPPPSDAEHRAPILPTARDVSSFGKSAASTAKSPPSREDLDGIIAQYRMAFEAGGPGAAEAALQLATFYHHGIGVERDVANAAKLFRYALENGVLDNLAAFQLGLIYNQGCPGLASDPKEAVRWWLVSAKLGNSVAMFNLGVMFMKGSGCAMDPTIAMQFFQQAHAINPKLRPPEFTPVQLAERVQQASRLKKLRQKAELTDEERKRRHDQAMETLRYTAYGTALVVGTTISAVLLRNWWKNRL